METLRLPNQLNLAAAQSVMSFDRMIEQKTYTYIISCHDGGHDGAQREAVYRGIAYQDAQLQQAQRTQDDH